MRVRVRQSAWLLVCAALCAACKVELGPGGGDNPDGSVSDPDAQGGPDSAIDAAPLGPWGQPSMVPGASTAAGEDDGSLSSTTNELIFSVVDAAAGTKDLWYMYRASPTSAWSAPSKLPFNSSPTSDETPRFSPDDLTLYFASDRPGGLGGLDIYRVTRTATGPGGTWGTPQLVPGVSTAGTDKWFMPCSTGNTYLTIVGTNIGEGTVGSPPAVNAQLSSGSTETGTFLSKDCLTTYFASTRSGTNLLYVSTRTAIGAAWSTPVLVTDFQMLGGAQEDPWVSADLRTFAFVSNISGSKDLYISTR